MEFSSGRVGWPGLHLMPCGPNLTQNIYGWGDENHLMTSFNAGKARADLVLEASLQVTLF
jgi:hypothetical protein